jgi:RNA polymerase sigma factor (sigma-70 family)
MTSAQTHPVLRHIRELAAAETTTRLPDRELLERFAVGHEETAFAALVRRHGPMVLGVCHRVLHDVHDVEDAFQATFLILARKAGSAGRRASLGTWLYQVAYHAALRARQRTAVRRRHEEKALPRRQPDPLAEVTGRELMSALDEELHKLPERLRAPLVLCYLEGKARDEAARELGCSLGTLKRRLEQGRAGLHARLARRGIAPAALLAAGMGAATVPSALAAATVSAARLVAAGNPAAVPERVVSLMSAGLGAMTAVPRKVVGTALLATTLIAATVGLLGYREPAAAGGGPPPAAAEKPAAGAEERPARPAPADEQEVTLAGRVLDGSGKPVAGAEVGALSVSCRADKDKYLQMITLGGPGLDGGLLRRARADGEGRYRLSVPHWARDDHITLVGVAPGHAVGWAPVAAKGGRADVVLRLPAEEPVRGRLFDLQGQPAAGVRVYVVKATREVDGEVTGVGLFQAADDAPFWPAPVTTDEKGRLALRGVTRAMSLTLRLHDDRFALSDLVIEPGQKEEARKALSPARIIEGRVIKEDSREPVPGVIVQLGAEVKAPHHFGYLTVRTDKQGRFRVNHYASDYYYLRTEDIDGQPYFSINHIGFGWPDKLKTTHAVEVTLPRGVLQSGKVVDAATGKPIAGAGIAYLPQLYNNPFLEGKNTEELWTRQAGRAHTNEDGSFQVPVLPGPGHVEVNAGGYVSYVRTRKEIFGHERLGGSWAANGFVKIDVKPGAAPPEVTAKLQPSRPFRGRLVDADGKPVSQARLAVRTFSADPHRESGIHEEVVDGSLQTGPTIPVKDGGFELPTCDPNEVYRVFVLDEQSRRAATAMLEDKRPEDKPLTVRWQACGSAAARFVDADGKPAGQYPVLVWVREPLKPGQPAAGEMRTAAPFHDVVVTDADGKATLDHLIPGVRYLLLQPDGKEVKELAVEPGQKSELGDIVVDPRK